MSNDFYSKSFEKYNITIITPNNLDQEIIHNAIFPELKEGVGDSEKKIMLVDICNKIIVGFILGCTELTLMIRKDDFKIEVLDTLPDLNR